MKKDIDNQPRLGYDVNTVDDQKAIEDKYEKELSKTPEDRLLDEIFGNKKVSEKAWHFSNPWYSYWCNDENISLDKWTN